MKTLMIIWVISLILSAVALALALVVRIKLKKRLTRFEKFTCCETELVDLLEEVYGLDPYTDDSPWATDGYETCKEWLASEIGAKGEFSWQKNKKEKTPLESYYDMALLDMTLRNIKGEYKPPKIPYGKTIEFAPYKPLEVKEASE